MGENEIEILDCLGAVGRRASDGDALAMTAHVRNMRVGLQREFLVESGERVCADLRVADGADAAAPAEHRNVDTQAMQRLAQFQSDDPRADHRHGFGQIGPVEHVVADEQSVAEGFERIRVGGARAGRDDDARGRDARMVGDL